jgi:hypothetical protein
LNSRINNSYKYFVVFVFRGRNTWSLKKTLAKSFVQAKVIARWKKHLELRGKFGFHQQLTSECSNCDFEIARVIQGFSHEQEALETQLIASTLIRKGFDKKANLS